MSEGHCKIWRSKDVSEVDERKSKGASAKARKRVTRLQHPKVPKDRHYRRATSTSRGIEIRRAPPKSPNAKIGEASTSHRLKHRAWGRNSAGAGELWHRPVWLKLYPVAAEGSPGGLCQRATPQCRVFPEDKKESDGGDGNKRQWIRRSPFSTQKFSARRLRPAAFFPTYHTSAEQDRAASGK